MVHTRLYLVRHCDVENPQGVLYGFLPNFPLSAKGRQQAEALAHFFADKPIRQIYVSPLQRAQETAKIIASRHPVLPVTTTEELTESHFSRYLQGVPFRQIPWRRPLWFLHHLARGVFDGDETIDTMSRRVAAPLARLLRDYSGDSGICISHGDPIQAFWNRHRGKGRFFRLHCAKGGMLALDYEDARLARITYHAPESLGAPPTAEPLLEEIAKV